MRPESAIAAPVLLPVARATWSDGPAALPKGAKMSVLEGTPPFATEKTFTLLVKMPKNYTIAPHSHLVTERVTVLEGAVSFGHGKKLDRAGATKVTSGGLVLIPAGHVHYAFTTDQETTIALTGVGPWEIIYVDPKDDPRPTPARMPAQPVRSNWDVPLEEKIIQANAVAFGPTTKEMRMPSGVKMAVLEGDPQQAKTFTVRLQFPKGSKLPLHAFAHSERLFVLSGGAKIGVGETEDDKTMQDLKAPAVIVMPQDTMHHASMDDGAVVQIFGVGPLETRWAEPSGAPRGPR